VEDDAFDAGATVLEALHVALVRSTDLSIVFDLARRPQLRVEHLTALDFRSLPAVGLEQIESALSQNYGDLAMAMKRKCPDEALFAQVPKIALARISRLAVVVKEIARRRDPKRADDGQCARFRTTERVL